MKPQTKKFLEFHGQELYFSLINGQWFIAIKPICNALEVNFNRQFQNLKTDPIFSRVFAIQQMHDKSNRLQEMACLPERFIYGWLISIKSASESLIKYKLECYEVLFEYFHGAITGRSQLLKELHTSYSQFNKKHEELLKSNQEYADLIKIRSKTKEIKQKLNQNDREILAGKQLELTLS